MWSPQTDLTEETMEDVMSKKRKAQAEALPLLR